MTQRYDSSSELSDLRRLLSRIMLDLKGSRELARALYVRNMKSQFRQSLLGYAWLFFPPIATTLVWFMLNRSGAVKVAETSIPYPLFVLTGTLLWQAFMDSLAKPLNMLQLNAGMLIKLNFPREALIIAGIGETLTVSSIRLLLLIPVFIVSGVKPDMTILLFPIAFFLLLLLGTSVGIFLAPIGLLYKDIGRGINLVGQFLMYTAPVVYPLAQHGALKWANLFNPVTYPLQLARDCLTGQPAHIAPSLMVGAISCIILALGWIIFHVTMPRIIERLGM